MFYSGFGRGSHARIMMTASLMCLEDTTQAAPYFHNGSVPTLDAVLETPATRSQPG
jgi:hypothetical protein